MKLAEKNKSQELLTIFHVKLVEKKEIPRAARHFSHEARGIKQAHVCTGSCDDYCGT
jgi:hypothetical protein